jgi:hypothetical protein
MDKLAGYKMTYEKILEIVDKHGIKTIDGKKVLEDDVLFYFKEMLKGHELLGKNMLFGETIPTDYPRGSKNGVVILSRVYKLDYKSTLSHVLHVRETEEDMAAKAAFIQRYGEYGVKDEDLTWVTVLDPFFRA